MPPSVACNYKTVVSIHGRKPWLPPPQRRSILQRMAAHEL